MQNPQFQIIFSGENAAQDAEEFQRFLAAEFSDWGVSRANVQPADIGAVKSGEALAVAALVMAIPPTILATWDLALRLKLDQKFAKLVEWLRSYDSVVVEMPEPEVVAGRDLQTDKMLDAIAVASQSRSQVRW